MDIGSVTEQRFIRDVLENLKVRTILERWDDLGLSDCWLVAGCLFQTVWNVLSGLEAESRIKDYDLFYFEPADLSEAAENAVQRRVERVLGDLQIPAEAKNQARVHLWYEEHFGHPYPALANSREGIDRFLIPATCVGIRPAQKRHGGVRTQRPVVDVRRFTSAEPAHGPQVAVPRESSVLSRALALVDRGRDRANLKPNTCPKRASRLHSEPAK